MKTEAILTHQAVSASIGLAFGNKKAKSAFEKTLKEMGE